MLSSYKMIEKNGSVFFPPELKEVFLEQAGGLNYKYSGYRSAEDIWNYLTEEAPRRFPYAFDDRARGFVLRLSPYAEMFWIMKYIYSRLSLVDRISAAKKNGRPVVFTQGGQTVEPYHAADVIACRPYIMLWWAGSMVEGMDYRERALRDQKNAEDGRREISPEACHMIGAHWWIRSNTTPVDMIVPYHVLRCSDMPYLTESHRSSPRKTPIHLVDYPANGHPDEEWNIDYVAENLRRLKQRLVEIGGKDFSDEDLRATIKLLNRGRKACREAIYDWWDAPYLPTYSSDLKWLVTLSNDCLGDPVAAVEMTEQAAVELKERKEKGIKAAEVAEDAVRIFVCGSCYTPDTYAVEQAGGTVIGYDDQWNRAMVDVEEEGDPYRNLAKALLALPYERPTKERALWTAEQVIRSKSEGLIFAYNWGCQFQSAVARMIADIVKKETGVPILYLELDSLIRMEQTEQSQGRVESFVETLVSRKKPAAIHAVA